MAKPVVLIDGDFYLYMASAACEHDVQWDEENHVLVGNAAEAYEIVKARIEEILEHFNSRDHAIAVGEKGDRCFRYDLYPQYKGNRKATRKPLGYFDVLDRLKAEYNVISFPKLEADDVVGILATKPGNRERIIVSRDKDLKTIPGKLWNGKKFYNIPEAEADYYHMLQTLMGDVTDGYSGCPGIGPKKAEAILNLDHEDLRTRGTLSAEVKGIVWRAIVRTFESKGLTEADALVQARLARILRWTDWDSEKKEPILWTP